MPLLPKTLINASMMPTATTGKGRHVETSTIFRPRGQLRRSERNTSGVITLTLHTSSYDWQFVPENRADLDRQWKHQLPFES